jgi:hypothetical protein
MAPLHRHFGLVRPGAPVAQAAALGMAPAGSVVVCSFGCGHSGACTGGLECRTPQASLPIPVVTWWPLGHEATAALPRYRRSAAAENVSALP